MKTIQYCPFCDNEGIHKGVKNFFGYYGVVCLSCGDFHPKVKEVTK